jgi:hypothetical protein
MGCNILGKHISFEKIVARPRVNVGSQNKKKSLHARLDPTTNKGDAGSLTIFPNDTGTRVSVSSQNKKITAARPSGPNCQQGRCKFTNHCCQ